MTLTGLGEPERVSGAVASASFFKVVGASPAAGRWISEEDDRAAGERVAVISHVYWQRRFGGAASAIGQSLVLDGQPFRIVGVAPAGYEEVWRPDVWVPLGLVGASTNRDSNFLLSFGRLKPGTAISDARVALADLAERMRRDNAIDQYTFTALPLHEVVTDSASQGLWILLGASGLLLLIACANVTSLLLARSVSRQRDLAIRASLGGTRRRLVGHVAAESIAIGVIACAIGAGMAWIVVRLFIAWAPATYPRIGAIGIDLRVLLFAAGAGLLTALIAGLGPTVHVMRANWSDATRGSGNRSLTSSRMKLVTRALVVIEMSMALALVIAAGLLAESVIRLDRQDLGFTREPVLTFTVGLPPQLAPDSAAVARIHGEFLDRVRSIGGVTHASAINLLPIARTGSNGPVRRAEDAPDSKGVPVTEFRAVMDGYFEAMGVHLLSGRTINANDRSGTPDVAVLNDVLAEKLFPGVNVRDVVGRQVRIGWLRGVASDVVGVVASVRSRRPDAPPDPEVYIPFAQQPQQALTYVVRSAGDVSGLTASIRTALASVAPDVPVAAVRTLDDVVSSSTRLSRLNSWLSVIFGLLATALAVLGVYSVLSYAVAQRMREFAIRSAIGASRPQLVAMVLREGALLSVIGVVLGAAIAFQASTLLRSLLFGVSETDPFVFAGAALGVSFIAAVGYLVPAARAARADPIEALRGE